MRKLELHRSRNREREGERGCVRERKRETSHCGFVQSHSTIKLGKSILEKKILTY